MHQKFEAYLKSRLPTGFPSGTTLVEEGRQMAAEIPWHKNRFLSAHGYENWFAYCQDCHRRGKEVFTVLLGLATLEEQLDALKKIEAFCDETGIEARSVQMIPSSLVGLPAEYWDAAPKPTSYLLRCEADWKAHEQAAVLDVCWEDWHLTSPNSLAETRYALNAGTSRLGSFAQFHWDYPGWDDELARFSDMFRSIGIVSAYRDQGMTVASYPEDGLGGYFMDLCSMLGYVMLERYIIEDLCHARMTMGYGGLMPDILPRMAFGLACHTLFEQDGRQFLTYYNGSTTRQWSHDIEANYSIGTTEVLIQSVFNRKYGIHASHKPVSITEALRVPTLSELLDIVRCGAGAAERADEWLNLIDFAPFEAMRDVLIEQGTKFYQNLLSGFAACGVDIRDPLQLVLMLRRCDPGQLEQEFHPSTASGAPFRPFVPTSLYQQTQRMQQTLTDDLREKGYAHALRGRTVVCASADGHAYGLMLIRGVFEALDAQVIDGGVNLEPSAALDLADEAGTPLLAVSTHCGQSLDYARQLAALRQARHRSYRVVMGGMLNAMLPGYGEPVDVSAQINALGVCASNDLETQLLALLEPITNKEGE